MNQLTIRGVDDELKRQLRVRAAQNGRSMEEARTKVDEILGALDNLESERAA